MTSLNGKPQVRPPDRLEKCPMVQPGTIVQMLDNE